MIPVETSTVARQLAELWGKHPPRKRWALVSDELERRGLGAWPHGEIAAAVVRLPIETHPLAPLTGHELEALEQSWRDGWALEFGSEPYPGRRQAIRRIFARRDGT